MKKENAFNFALEIMQSSRMKNTASVLIRSEFWTGILIYFVENKETSLSPWLDQFLSHVFLSGSTGSIPN